MYMIKNSKNKLRRIVSIFSICIIVCLCGCTINVLEEEPSIVSQTYSEGEYTGLWTHTEYPDSYSIVIFEQQGDEISFEVTAIRGNGLQIATSKATNVKLASGKGKFRFVDSFENAGTGEIDISDDELVLKYSTDEPYKGNWCIDAGEGSYVKSKKLSEIDWTNEDVTLNDTDTIDLEQFGVTDKWMYRVIEYTKSGEDIYDDDIDFNISSPEEFEENTEQYFMTENSYDSIDSTKDGYITAYASDRTGYDAKILLERFDGSKEILYFKVVIPNCVFKFIYENGAEFGTYETMDYAHRNYNTDGGGYRRDDYEYKKYHNKSSKWRPGDE